MVSGEEAIIRPIAASHWYGRVRERAAASSSGSTTAVPDRHAVEAAFKVKVEDVRTITTAGKLRRRGRFSGYRSDWKKAYVRLKPGQKMPEYAEI